MTRYQAAAMLLVLVAVRGVRIEWQRMMLRASCDHLDAMAAVAEFFAPETYTAG